MTSLHDEKKPSRHLVARFFKTILSVFVITSFVVVIAVFVKLGTSTTFDDINTQLSPIYAKLGVDSNQVGDVAGAFFTRLSNTDIKPDTNNPIPMTTPSVERSDIVARIAVVADIHSDLDHLTNALTELDALSIDYLICIGDLTDYGEIVNLTQVKQLLDNSGFDYSCLPGDHDLYQSVNADNYMSVFGEASISRFYTKNINGSTFVFFDNSANFTVIPEIWTSWFAANLVEADYVVLSQPIYHPLISVLSPIMGIVNGEKNDEVYKQGQWLVDNIRNSDVTAIIAADHHRSSNNQDPINKNLSHIVVGSLAKEEKRNLQTPRYTLFSIYSDGTYSFEDIVL